MSVDAFEQDVLRTANEWSFIRSIETVDKTDQAIKLRLQVDAECFVQVYANVRKNLFSYTLVLNRSRIYGRDSEGETWHRHPYGDPDSHDRTPEGQLKVDLAQFLVEVQQILQAEGLL